jgi:hypothetical protein
MYLKLLMGVLDDSVVELSGPALVDYTVMCRTEMLRSESPRDGGAHVALATEVTYDRTLIRLCFERGLDVDLTEFSYPIRARLHLETELAEQGIDLGVPFQVRVEI